jgi:hypothetical protein
MPTSETETSRIVASQFASLAVLEHCGNCLFTLSDQDSDASGTTEASLNSTNPFVDQPKALSTLLDFIEIGRIPSDWTYEDPDSPGDADDEEMSAMTRDNCEKRLGKAKASAIRMIIHVSWDISFDTESTFWKRMLDWTAKGPERDDLVSCGLLSIGNGAKNGRRVITVRTPTAS